MGWNTLNVCKTAYNVVRENGKEIYKAFGFRHLSNVTQYYVHPDNESISGNTTLCQPIGEALILFTTMLRECAAGNVIGDYFVSRDCQMFFLDIEVPGDFRENGVVEEMVHRYCALLSGNHITICAYDADGFFLEGGMEYLDPLYKLLPVFLVMLARERETSQDFHTLMDTFVQKPSANLFVNLHEDFYQAHKREEYTIRYDDILPFDTTEFTSFADDYSGDPGNMQQVRQATEVAILAFPEDAFSEEQKAYIPHLSEEFMLPANLRSLCSAVTAGDMLAVLFHGPAGTGKTMTCKLVCQSVGLPILETINCTENLDEFVLGKYIPQNDRIIFRESYVTKAIREGGAVVFEEINFARPQYLSFLNSLLDDNGFVRLDNGDVVRRHPNFRFFATMNLGYFGTKKLNQALYNRFNGIIEIASLSDEAIRRMLTVRVPECTPMVNKILGVYHKLKRKIESEELDVVISPRNLENWAKLARYEGYIRAAEKTIIPIARCDRMLEDTIRGILMLYKWNV